MAYTTNAALSALADPTRRSIFDQLKAGPRAVGEIVGQVPVSQPAVSQHLKVLKEAGLVLDEAAGARRIYRIDPRGIGALRSWLETYWTQQLNSFAQFAESEAARDRNPTKEEKE